MPFNEKELNCNLFDQLSIIEEAQEIAKEENAEKTLRFLEMKKRQIERKLYQEPPLLIEKQNSKNQKRGC